MTKWLDMPRTIAQLQAMITQPLKKGPMLVDLWLSEDTRQLHLSFDNGIDLVLTDRTTAYLTEGVIF